jgi:hypothetical protein
VVNRITLPVLAGSAPTGMSSNASPEGYQRFDDREDGWTKVILHP